MSHGKRYREAAGNVDHEHEYQPVEAIKLLKAQPDAKFDETIEIAFRLGLDTRKADQSIRGTVSLPNGTGRSVRVGVFMYRGDGSGIDFPFVAGDESTFSVQDRHFLRTGIYASLFYQDLNVFSAYLHGTDSLELSDPATASLLGTTEPSYHAWFTQADYVFYPWLQGGFRYETLTPGDRTVESLRSGVFNLSALVRANVKVMAEYQRDLRQGENHSFNAILRFAF